MRISCAIALLLAVAGCQRSSTPPPAPTATASAAVSTASPPQQVAAPSPAVHHEQKAFSGVLTVDAARAPRRPAQSRDSFDNRDPCAGLDGAALDDCVARDDSGQATNAENSNDSSLDRPELTPRDRELMEADAAAARDQAQADQQFSQSQDDPSQEDQSVEDGSQDQPPDDYSPAEEIPPDQDNPPDENSDEPPPDDPYQH